MHLIKRQPATQIPFSYYGSDSFSPFGLSVSGSVRKQLEAYMHWVYVCVKIRAEAFAKANFRVYTEKGDKRVYVPKDNPAQAILDYPNPYFSRYTFQFLQSIHLDLTGNFYAYIARDRLGVPRLLFPLPPDRVEINPGTTADNLIDSYEFNTYDNNTYTFKADEVLHIKEPSPLNLISGYSPTQAAALLIDVFDSQMTWQRNFYEKDATPDLTIESDKKIEDGEKKAFISHWMEMFGGKEKKRRMAVLDQGLKAKILSVPPKDLQLAESQDRFIKQIFGHFRVPLSKAGMNESQHTRATAEAYNYTFYSDTVDPRLVMVEEQYNIDLMNVYFKQFGFRVDHENIIPNDEERQANIDKVNVDAGLRTRNELRERDGLSPVDGGDAVLVGSNVVPISSL